MALAHHADAIRLLAKDRRSLRLQRAKKDATINRLREKIRTLEITVRTQQDQIWRWRRMEKTSGGDDFLSDDNDFEEDEFTEEEDYEFLEAGRMGSFPSMWMKMMRSSCTSFTYVGPARAWWTSTRAMNAGQMMTWADFKLKFSKYHVPPGLIKKMRDEFRELKHGRMSVEYRDRFLTLPQFSQQRLPKPYRWPPLKPRTEGNASLRTVEVGESQVFGPDVLRGKPKRRCTRSEYLKTAQSRQKSYADKRRREMTFEIGDFVYLKVSPLKGMQRFQLKGKLAPRYVGPFKVLSRRGEVSYQLELPEEMAAVHNVSTSHCSGNAWKYLEKTEVFKNIDHRLVDINTDLTYHGAYSHPGRSIQNPHQEYQVPEDSMEQSHKKKPLGNVKKT
ncbi:hypothetical protein QYE76_020731 [Lolium multiflorum]|uniref:Retrotransposon gag domain-containing protein n=1 Tax=Lolium multiflorum TaxID=4521 RepID=A0AAD8VQA1_LOLMU|nr:hypothetical protein QYE76_020731 [Lolium multiflorum]